MNRRRFFILQSDKTIGYLKQSDSFESEHTVIEEVEAIFVRDGPRMEEEMLERLPPPFRKKRKRVKSDRRRSDAGPVTMQMQEEYRDKGGYTAIRAK